MKAYEPHYDAKVFPHVHPYGTGSLLSEEGSGAITRLVRNRACAMQSWFRRSAQWAFFYLDLWIKRVLFFQNAGRRKHGRRHGVGEQDRFARTFGTIVPANIPESTAWWARQAKALGQRRGRGVWINARQHTFAQTIYYACVSFPRTSHARLSQQELAAITDDAEGGLMQAMVTITHNNRAPEMLAAVRRGPFAVPTKHEKI